MSQIHNVTGARARPAQQIHYFCTQLRQRGKERHWIKIPLNRSSMADVHPRLVDIHPPIHPNDITTCGVQFTEKAAGSCAKVDHWNTKRTDSFNEGTRVRLDEADIIL